MTSGQTSRFTMVAHFAKGSPFIQIVSFGEQAELTLTPHDFTQYWYTGNAIWIRISRQLKETT